MQCNKPLSYAKFLKDMCTKKRKTNAPKKFFLATNISELLSNQITVKYKDTGYPTISCIIGKTEINRALIDLGASINKSLSQYTYNLGWANLARLKSWSS